MILSEFLELIPLLIISLSYWYTELPSNTALVALFRTLYGEPIGEMAEEYTDVGGVAHRRSPDSQRRSPDPNAPIYGELIVLG